MTIPASLRSDRHDRNECPTCAGTAVRIHRNTHIALSTEVMAEFGKISDGISLYSSSFITTKLYQFYAIYSWLQLVVGPLPTVVLSYGLFSSFLKDSEGEQAPAVVTTVKDVGIGAATGGVSGAAGAVARKI